MSQITNAKIAAVRASFTRNAPASTDTGSLWMYQVDLARRTSKKGEPLVVEKRTVWPFAHDKHEAQERAFTQIGEADLNDHHGWSVTKCSRV